MRFMIYCSYSIAISEIRAILFLFKYVIHIKSKPIKVLQYKLIDN